MRIIHVLHSHGYGGAENHALMLMRGQRAAGHDVMFAGPQDSWLGQACAAENIPACHIGMHGLFDLVSHWKLRRLARRWQADIVHGHLIRGAMYAGHAGHRQHRPLAVCTAHATTAKTHMHRCAHIIAVSDAVRQNLAHAGYDIARMTVVHNGVPDVHPQAPTSTRQALREELGIPDHVVAVVNAGRFIHDKGQDLLLDALAHTPENVHLYLIGAPDTPYGEQVLKRSFDRSRVHFLGYRKDVQRILPAFDIYALSSRREALPLSLVEAMAARLPVVATTVGGIPEIVEHERTGLLVPPDHPTALAAAVTRFHDDPDMAHRLALAGRDHYERFLTDARMVEQTLAVYQRCLAATHP
ncbi:MAG: glycosyltransferase [Aquabacterium sp.]|jgi:glycosyltransferase involved in cell wall biosynthesis|uniref:glycosyltransferase n=1 Tax=Aquabacterium sp. TaxID=1872578 RepID=UPI002A36F99C|nr:glycosyltransferase [Aquabacterium sp.]MDX9844569.1 glycosyltransferase [Aquabacterium sp.]